MTAKAATQVLTTASHMVIPPGFQGYDFQSGPDLPDPMQLRFFITGMPGSGKTTWGSSIPNALVIDTEDSARFVPDPRGIRIVPKTGKDFEGIIRLLISQAGKSSNTIKHVVVDTVESALELLIPWITEKHNEGREKKVDDIREYGRDGAGWGKVNAFFLSLFSDLYRAGYGWTALGHVKEVERPGSTPGTTTMVYRPAVNPGIMGGLYRNSQYMGMIRSTTKTEREAVKTTSGATVMGAKKISRIYNLDLTSPDSSSTITQMVKDRLGQYLPSSFEITGDNGFKVFSEAYNKARDAIKK